MSQIGIPVEIPIDQLLKVKSFGRSMEFCAQIAGYDLDKTLQQELGVDKAQFSRWTSNKEGIIEEKLEQMMDFCGNDAPLFYLLNKRGYDVLSIRKKQSELEKQLEEKEKIIADQAMVINTFRTHLSGFKAP